MSPCPECTGTHAPYTACLSGGDYWNRDGDKG